MEKNIEELEDSELEALLAEFDRKLSEKPEAIYDEEAFPSDDLIDIATIVHYLSRTGIVADAEAVYSNLYKTVVAETVRRLGELPYI